MKTAVIVIDVQVGLFPPADLPARAVDVIERINHITERARANGLPVIFVQHETKEAPLQFDSLDWQLHQDLICHPDDEKIRKTTPDSFLRTPLMEKLKEQEVERLVICGYASEFCVETTVRRAAGLGFEIVLVSDAHTTHDKAHLSGEKIAEHVNSTLPSIKSFGVVISAIPAAGIVL